MQQLGERETILAGSKINGKTKIAYNDWLTKKRPETFCFALVQECLKISSKNFRVEAVRQDIDGLLVEYRCSLDGRKYQMKITAVDHA